MSEWWSYRPGDFLLFAPRTYWRLFEGHNLAWWPLPPVLLAVGLGLAGVLLIRGQGYRIAMVLLAGMWLFTGAAFVLGRYVPVNWAVLYLLPLFPIQALLLIIGAARPVTGAGGWPFRSLAGGLLLFLGVLVVPGLAPLAGRPWAGAEIIGMAPDPTAIATLGVALLLRGRLAALLLVAPVIWCLASAATLAAMGEAQAWLPLAAALLAIAARILRS